MIWSEEVYHHRLFVWDRKDAQYSDKYSPAAGSSISNLPAPRIIVSSWKDDAVAFKLDGDWHHADFLRLFRKKPISVLINIIGQQN